MGNTASLEGEDKDKYIEEQKKIIREQQDQIQKTSKHCWKWNQRRKNRTRTISEDIV